MMKHVPLLAIFFALFANYAQAQQLVAVGCGPMSSFYEHAATENLKVLRITPVPETGNSIIIAQQGGPDGPVVAFTLINDKQCVVFSALPLGPFFGVTAKEAEPPQKAPPMPQPRVQAPDAGA